MPPLSGGGWLEEVGVLGEVRGDGDELDPVVPDGEGLGLARLDPDGTGDGLGEGDGEGLGDGLGLGEGEGGNKQETSLY